MRQTFQCGENTALVGYVYDECEALERTAIDAHVAICAACAAELAALQSTRASLSSWTPPEVDLGFQIVRPTAPVFESRTSQSSAPTHVATENRPWFRRPAPAWAQAAAAAFIFVTGLSLGVARGIMPTAAAPGGAPASGLSAVSATDLVALERRLRAEIARIQPASAGLRDVPASSGSDEQLLARVRALIEESERRQQRELALRTAQVMRDVDSQRQVDLAHIQNSFGQIEGLTGAEVREQRQMLNYLIRASEQR
jgi:anti-sigma factor RsiW